MPDEARLLSAFLLPLVAAALATPVAIRVAARLDFYDRPTGWKDHSLPTPYLGGAAVVAGFVLGALLLGGGESRFLPVMLCALALAFVGTIDDRINLPASTRVAIEAAAGVALWVAGLGWSIFPGDLANMVLSAVWIVAVVNALNLLDLMDGVASSVAAVSAAGAGLLAVTQGDVLLGALSLSVSGACLGFLPYNLRRPARVFLGDGGSMPLGFLVGAVLMAVPVGEDSKWAVLLVAGLLFGLPLLDMGFRILSRRRRGISLLTGGPDSLANQLQRRLVSPRVVAATLALIQAFLSLLAFGALQLGDASVVAAWVGWFGLGTAFVAVLETRTWGAPEQAVGPVAATPPPPPRAGRVLPLEGGLLLFVTLACGLSPFIYGFYRVSVWGPIGMALLAVLLGLVIARPADVRRPALLALGGLAGLWLWSLLSIRWAESADQAMIEANRWLLYASLFAILVLVLRDDFLGRVVVYAATAAIAAFAGYVCVCLVAGGAGDMFLLGRLNEPLGYVNGVAGYLLVGLWPLIALAERARGALSAAAVAGTALVLSVLLLCQTRAVLPALVLSLLLFVVFVPGRTRRIWIMVVAGAAVLVAAGPLLEVYDSSRAGNLPTDDTLRAAGLAALAGALAAGVAWFVAERLVSTAGARIPRGAGKVLAAVPLAAVVVGMGVAGALSLDDPAQKVRDEYRAFVDLDTSEEGSSRFTTGSGFRYDYWRVAVKEFRDRPVAGWGAGNYDSRYFRERRTSEDIRQPHSLPLQLLAEVGIVGALFMAVFVVAAGYGLARRMRSARGNADQRFLVVAAGGMVVVWLVHTSVDWLHLIPGVTGFALAGVAVLVGPWRRPDEPARRAGIVRRSVVLGAAVLTLVGALTLGRYVLADHYRTQAQGSLAANPDAALARADDALSLNDESLQAYYIRAAALARRGEYAPARDALLEAGRREPNDFVSWALLGDLATRRGDRRLARRSYRRALRLNPRDRDLRSLVARTSGS